MKIAYLILAHKEPEQIIGLINKVSVGSSVHCFVHIDSNSKCCCNLIENEVVGRSIYSIYNTPWGSFNTVKAELFLINKALEWQADRLVMLSGQDYPIKGNDFIIKFFTKHSDIGFVEGEKMPIESWSEHQGGLNRVNRIYFKFARKWRAFPMHTKKKPLNYLFNGMAKILHILFLKSSLIPIYYNGSHWWAITKEQAAYVLKLSKDKSILKAFKYSINSDETFVSSILYNSPKNMFKLKSASVHFLKGLNKSAHADILDERDFLEITNSHFLFARKIDFIKSKNLIKLLN